jgi:hypothetical protein
LLFQSFSELSEIIQSTQSSAFKKHRGKTFSAKTRSQKRRNSVNEKIQLLNEKAVRVAGIYNRCEAELISILQEFDKHRGYLHFGCTSLHGYCVEVLKLSEATAFNFSTVCRKAVQVPELKAAIIAGEISVSKARKIAPVITKTNHDEWLTLAKTSSSREIEKAVAKAQPQLAIKESVKYVTEDRISLTVGLSEKTIEKLKRVMDLESQRTKSAASREDALTAALDAYLEKHDPLKKAERATSRAEKTINRTVEVKSDMKVSAQSNAKPVPGQERARQIENSTQKTFARVNRPKLPAALVHAVHMRDQRQCTFNQNNKRCGATRWLDVHHIIPRVKGGPDTVENLTTICSTHHRLIHSFE